MNAWAVAFGVLLLAGSARAQFEECVQPSSVPANLFDTIIEVASFDFGALDESVCQKITNKGVSTCKSQVKAAAKCFNRSLDASYEISIKQCNQLEDSTDRSECKAGVKTNKQEGKDEVETDKQEGLAECEGEFADELSAICDLGVGA